MKITLIRPKTSSRITARCDHEIIESSRSVSGAGSPILRILVSLAEFGTSTPNELNTVEAISVSAT